MAEFLVRAQDNKTGTYVQGDIVEVRANDAFYGAQEGLPDFAVVKVPAVSLAQVRQYMTRWRIDLQFSVVASDTSADGFRIDLTNGAAGVSAGGITRAQVEAFITRWGGGVVNVGANFVRFDITIWDAIRSPGFWDHGLVGFAFQETDYNQATGVHTVRVSYAASGRNPNGVEAYIEDRVDNILSHTGSVITFEVSRGTVKQSFLDDIKRAADSISLRSRRYYIDQAQVDTIVASGGTITVTPAQLQTNLKDRTLE